MKSPAEIVVDTLINQLKTHGGFDGWWDSLDFDTREELLGKLVVDVAAIVPTRDEWETIENLTQAVPIPGRRPQTIVPMQDAQIDAVSDVARRVMTLCRSRISG